MTIKIYEEYGTSPVEVWENYPFVPNVGDNVSTPVSGFKTVVYRVLKKTKYKLELNKL